MVLKSGLGKTTNLSRFKEINGKILSKRLRREKGRILIEMFAQPRRSRGASHKPDPS